MTFHHPDFKLQREVPLPHLRAHARELEHEPTGLRLLHLETDDPENCFALAFPTPPDDDSGVPHILEHAVLAGSERFPVREPFFELIKTSPAGFINAMTSDVWTIYPICTTLEGDFFNLAEVYADAVFHPLLTRETFEREGHHLQVENARLKRSGIVYNEMKGAYSNTEMLLAYRLKNRAFPGGALGHDAGGDPRAIPTLTWEKLRDFHARFYAPGNALLFLYGDIPLQKQLDFWGEKLQGLPHRPSLAARPHVENWDAPQKLETSYAAEPGAELSEQTFLSLRWKCGDALDREEEMAWQVLSFLLAGHDGAPLKRALVDSKLGADVFACGVEDVESELSFHVALRGSERERADEFQNFVLRELESIAAHGFERSEVETALRQVSYATLEVASLFPLHLAFEIGRYASCGADPLAATRSREALEAVREKAEKDADFWPRMLRERLVQNPHRLLVALYPDPQHAERERAHEAQSLAELQSALSETDLHTIQQRAQELEAAQNEPNSPEALATLPILTKADLPDAPREIPTTTHEIAGFTTLRNDVFSNGVVYIEAAVDVRDLPPQLWKYLPRWADAFGKMGTEGQSWEKVAARRAAFTGGLSARPSAFLEARNGEPRVDVRFKLKTLASDINGALDLLGDLLFRLEPDDRSRLFDVQGQHLAALRESLVNDAMRVATLGASRAVSPVGWLSYLWGSPLSLRWNREMQADFNTRAGQLAEGIGAVRDFLLGRARWTWSFTGPDAAWQTFETRLQQWSERMNAGPDEFGTPARGTDRFDGGESALRRVGFATPLDVQFCVRALPAPAQEKEPLVDLGLALASYDYLLPEIRLKGNAYGAGARLASESGLAMMFSYRDPRLSETLAVFDGLEAWVERQKWSDGDLERALLGNVGDAVPAIRPEGATGAALSRFRQNETPEMRANQYRAKLSASGVHTRQTTLEWLESAKSDAATAVAASRIALEGANAELEIVETI